jgi:hypothetical protein
MFPPLIAGISAPVIKRALTRQERREGVGGTGGPLCTIVSRTIRLASAETAISEMARCKARTTADSR